MEVNTWYFGIFKVEMTLLSQAPEGSVDTGTLNDAQLVSARYLRFRLQLAWKSDAVIYDHYLTLEAQT